jgi:hypothetical protein
LDLSRSKDRSRTLLGGAPINERRAFLRSLALAGETSPLRSTPELTGELTAPQACEIGWLRQSLQEVHQCER